MWNAILDWLRKTHGLQRNKLGKKSCGSYSAHSKLACYPRLKMTAINILYHKGGGSQDIDLVQEMPDPKYQATKRTVIRYMKANNVAPGAIEMLEQFPFSLWQATNDFGDDFEVLYMKAPMELYVEIENEIGIWRQRIIDG